MVNPAMYVLVKPVCTLGMKQYKPWCDVSLVLARSMNKDLRKIVGFHLLLTGFGTLGLSIAWSTNVMTKIKKGTTKPPDDVQNFLSLTFS